jgi:hypothetical protein
MNAKYTEELKDAIIDQLYDYLNLTKFKIIKTSGGIYSSSPELNIMDNPEFAKKINSEEFESGYYKSGKEYCRLLTAKGPQSGLMTKLRNRKVPELEMATIQDAVDFLISTGYVVQNQPVTHELKLSPKGINHFEKGLSFSKDYFNQTVVRNSDRRSWISLIIAALSVIIAIANYVIKKP